MCAVSILLAYGRENFPRDSWTTEGVVCFQIMIDWAEEFDNATGQPDCTDSDKVKFLDELEVWIAEKRMERYNH